eukprot:scaffold13710_cov122-Isochrysis_galbana.AAC.4
MHLWLERLRRPEHYLYGPSDFEAPNCFPARSLARRATSSVRLVSFVGRAGRLIERHRQDELGEQGDQQQTERRREGVARQEIEHFEGHGRQPCLEPFPGACRQAPHARVLELQHAGARVVQQLAERRLVVGARRPGSPKLLHVERARGAAAEQQQHRELRAFHLVHLEEVRAPLAPVQQPEEEVRAAEFGAARRGVGRSHPAKQPAQLRRLRRVVQRQQCRAAELHVPGVLDGRARRVRIDHGQDEHAVGGQHAVEVVPVDDREGGVTLALHPRAKRVGDRHIGRGRRKDPGRLATGELQDERQRSCIADSRRHLRQLARRGCDRETGAELLLHSQVVEG